MPSDTPSEYRGPLKLGAGAHRLAEWAEHATDDDFEAVASVLLAVQDRSWSTRFAHLDDVTRLGWQYHIVARPGLILTVRFYREYPGDFGLIFIGSPGERLA